MVEVKITTNFITLGQLLKFKKIVNSGSDVKSYLIENIILVNNQPENRRGRKLFPNDIISVDNIKFIIVK